MDFVRELGDTTNIPWFGVGGIARAEIIDGAIVRITFYKARGKKETGPYVPLCELDFSLPAWLAVREVAKAINKAVQRGDLEREVEGARLNH